MVMVFRGKQDDTNHKTFGNPEYPQDAGLHALLQGRNG